MSAEPEGLHLNLGRTRVEARAEVTVVRSGEPLPFGPQRWHDSLVLVQSGVVRMTCLAGAEAVFEAGSVLYFRGLPLASISADGEQDAVLLVISRSPRDPNTGS